MCGHLLLSPSRTFDQTCCWRRQQRTTRGWANTFCVIVGCKWCDSYTRIAQCLVAKVMKRALALEEKEQVDKRHREAQYNRQAAILDAIRQEEYFIWSKKITWKDHENARDIHQRSNAEKIYSVKEPWLDCQPRKNRTEPRRRVRAVIWWSRHACGSVFGWLITGGLLHLAN